MNKEQATQDQDAGGALSGRTASTGTDGASGSLSRAEVDRLVYRCRQAGDDSTYALARAIEERLVSRVASVSGAQSAEAETDALTLLQLSAPKRIYLDIGLDLGLVTPPRFDQLEGVTWSEDNATSHGIPYDRGDLAAAASDDGATALRGLLQEVAACYTRDDDLPNNLLARIDTALSGGAAG